MLEAGYAAPELAGRGHKLVELIVQDVLGCYTAIDNGNKVEGTDDFINAVIKRYGVAE